MKTLNKVKNQVCRIELKFYVVITGHIYGPMGHRIAQKWPISFRLGVTAKKHQKNHLFWFFT